MRAYAWSLVLAFAATFTASNAGAQLLSGPEPGASRPQFRAPVRFNGSSRSSSQAKPSPAALPGDVNASATEAKPMAILIRNPAAKAGAPPYALADDHGVVQRLVEPSPGITLEPHLGSIIRVRHDTGGTLLASQLDLQTKGLPAPSDRISLAKFRRSPIRTAQSLDALPPSTSPTGSSTGGELLPEPIVLEEVVGEPDGPILNGLQYPYSVSAGPAATAAPASSTPCAQCGSGVGGNCPHCALHAGIGLPSIGGLLSDIDASVDLLWLRAHDSAGLSGGSDFESGSRWELGINGPQRHRLALRYFEYDSPLAIGRLDMETIDIEFQRHISLGNRAEWAIGGGFRWAEYDEALTINASPAGVSYSDTIGPMIGIYGRMPAFGRVDGTVLLRQSWQFGDSSVGGGAGTFGNFGVTEFQFGLERRRQTRIGQTTVRGVLEAQNWSGAANAPQSSDRGLIGLGFGIGLRR